MARSWIGLIPWRCDYKVLVHAKNRQEAIKILREDPESDKVEYVEEMWEQIGWGRVIRENKKEPPFYV